MSNPSKGVCHEADILSRSDIAAEKRCGVPAKQEYTGEVTCGPVSNQKIVEFLKCFLPAIETHRWLLPLFFRSIAISSLRFVLWLAGCLSDRLPLKIGRVVCTTSSRSTYLDLLDMNPYDNTRWRQSGCWAVVIDSTSQ